MSKPTTCAFPDCDRSQRSLGYCQTHYRQLWSGIELRPINAHKQPKPCAFEGCAHPHSAKGYCKRHYVQFKNGRPLVPLGQKRTATWVDPSLGGWDRLSAVSEREESTRYDLEIPCLVWTGAQARRGYGVLSFRGRRWLAHRLAYFLTTGDEPELVRHRCDNPPCVEPSHLLAGTPLLNVQDRDERGRAIPPRGERNGHAKLTWQQVEEIRESPLLGYELAERYGVSKSTVSQIRNFKKWKRR